MKKNKKIMICGLVTVTIIMAGAILSGCIDEDKIINGSTIILKCEPIVVVTDINYSSDPDAIPYYGIHNGFSENYSGSDLSIELRDRVIQHMVEKADELGENSSILYEAIKITYYSDWETRPIRIPCYAEKAVYNGESIWAIAFNRANGFGESSLGHFNLYFVSISTLEAQWFAGCNATAIVYWFGCD